ncbi:MAG: MFS transporter [Deltaproteobacteria bacterium]|nr:MFS transporter [Deltaproteobacteria bacterium]
MSLRAALHLGRALRHRNYRLFFIGQGISVIGTWVTRFATSWLAYTMTGSPLILGLVTFCNNAPTPLIAPIAGVLIDRWNRRRVILLTQLAALLQSATLAVFALTDSMTVGHLLVLGAIQGVINGFDLPARQSFLRETIEDPAHLPNAIALNSSMVNLGKMIGPVIAAILVGLVGEGWCFAIDAASYLAVIAAVLAMRITPRPRAARSGKRVHTELADGVRYVRSVPLVRSVLILLATTSVLTGGYTSLLPVVATRTLGGDEHTLGILMGAAGIGALAGALFLASRTTVVGFGTLIGRTLFVLGASLAALELAWSIWIAVPLLFIIGLTLMIQMAATNSIVQTIVDHDKLGRVMSLYAVAFAGGMPIGALLEGALASRIGAIHTLAVAGAGCMIAALVFRRALPGLRALTRPLYVRLGLLGEESA